MKTLGRCWIAYGILRIVAGMVLMVFAPTATVMFGALLVRVAHPFMFMEIFHAFYVLAIALSFVCGILGIYGGLALLSRRSSSRMTLIVASVLSASNLPIGIVLSVFTLVRLLGAGAAETASRT